jgi:hypothetical protein
MRFWRSASPARAGNGEDEEEAIRRRRERDREGRDPCRVGEKPNGRGGRGILPRPIGCGAGRNSDCGTGPSGGFGADVLYHFAQRRLHVPIICTVASFFFFAVKPFLNFF